MATLVNNTDKPISFKIAGKPGEQVKIYLVHPGDTCEVPDGYCGGGGERSIIASLAPGLSPFKKEDKPKETYKSIGDKPAKNKVSSLKKNKG